MSDEEQGKGDLYDVFGSDLEQSDQEEEKREVSKEKDDEDSDFDVAPRGKRVLVDSDDDDIEIAPKKRKPGSSAPRRRAETAGSAEKKRKKKQRLKKSRGDDEEDEDDLGDVEDRRESQPVEEDSDDIGEAVDEEERAAEKALAKAGKGKKKRKRMNLDEMREIAEGIISRMWKARDEDLKSFKRDQPALEKLKMLSEVEDYCRRIDFRDVLLQCKLLGALRLWLDPMPDGTLPNQTIRMRLLQLLDTFPVGEDWPGLLKESGGLGKIVNFLSVKDSYEPNKRLCEKLKTKWARPIFDVGSKDQDVDRLEIPSGFAGGSTGRAKQKETLYERELKKSKAAKFYARLPDPVSFNFSKIPGSTLGDFDEDEASQKPESKKKANVERGLASLKNSKKKTNARAMTLSIEGRGLL